MGEMRTRKVKTQERKADMKKGGDPEMQRWVIPGIGDGKDQAKEERHQMAPKFPLFFKGCCKVTRTGRALAAKGQS